MADDGGRSGVGREEAEEWVEARLEGAPPRLADAIRRALARASPDEPPDRLAEWLAHAALGELGRVEAGRTGDRGQALRLLAADASLTFAFEVAAERSEELGPLAREWGPAGRLGDELAARRRGQS